jgi:hypothetical protein
MMYFLAILLELLDRYFQKGPILSHPLHQQLLDKKLDLLILEMMNLDFVM